MAIFAPWLVPIVAPGFDAPTTELTVRLTRIMLLSPVLIGMGAVVSGLLNSYERFAVPALAPLAYNLAIILAAIFLAPIMGVEGLAVGVVLGSLAHLAIQLPAAAQGGAALRPDHRPRASGRAQGRLADGAAHAGPGGRAAQLHRRPPSWPRAWRRAASPPTTMPSSCSQIPVGVLGVSVAVALFPTLSRDAALGRVAEIRRQVVDQPARPDLPRRAADGGHDRAGAARSHRSSSSTACSASESAERTAGALAFFAIGLVGHIVVHVLTRAFYAMQDTRTPVLWAIIAVAINVPLMAWLVGPMGVEGLALALSISAMLEVIGLLWALRRRIESIEERAVLRSAVRSAVAAVAAGAASCSAA